MWDFSCMQDINITPVEYLQRCRFNRYPFVNLPPDA
jgi:hypothetical protein